MTSHYGNSRILVRIENSVAKLNSKIKVTNLKRVIGLLEKGQLVLEQKEEWEHGTSIPDGPYIEWKAQSLAWLESLLTNKHSYYRSFELATEDKRSEARNVEKGLGVLKAAAEDLENDHLSEIGTLINAAIFSDFLEMAEHLLSEDYKGPAAVIAGAVLEEHLKRLCEKNAIEITQTKLGATDRKIKASQLVDELAKAGTLSKAEQHMMKGWQAIRNSAAHSLFNEFETHQVLQMIQGIGNFVATHPA